MGGDPPGVRKASAGPGTIGGTGGLNAKVGTMLQVALIVVLALAVGGCVCVVWAGRGGPRWVHAVAAVTLAAGTVVGGARRRNRRPNRWPLGGNSGTSGEG